MLTTDGRTQMMDQKFASREYFLIPVKHLVRQDCVSKSCLCPGSLQNFVVADQDFWIYF